MKCFCTKIKEHAFDNHSICLKLRFWIVYIIQINWHFNFRTFLILLLQVQLQFIYEYWIIYCWQKYLFSLKAFSTYSVYCFETGYKLSTCICIGNWEIIFTMSIKLTHNTQIFYIYSIVHTIRISIWLLLCQNFIIYFLQ